MVAWEKRHTRQKPLVAPSFLQKQKHCLPGTGDLRAQQSDGQGWVGVLTLECASASPGGLLRAQGSGPTPGFLSQNIWGGPESVHL